jgi:hypothetical protein
MPSFARAIPFRIRANCPYLVGETFRVGFGHPGVDVAGIGSDTASVRRDQRQSGSHCFQGSYTKGLARIRMQKNVGVCKQHRQFVRVRDMPNEAHVEPLLPAPLFHSPALDSIAGYYQVAVLSSEPGCRFYQEREIFLRCEPAGIEQHRGVIARSDFAK